MREIHRIPLGDLLANVVQQELRGDAGVERGDGDAGSDPAHADDADGGPHER